MPSNSTQLGSLYARYVGPLLTTLVVIVSGVLAWRLWGPVPEQPCPRSAEVRQWSRTTCGPAALATIFNAYQRHWSPQELEQLCHLSLEGTSLYDLQEAARSQGFQAVGLQATSPAALLRVARPFVAHLAPRHFVVVERREEDGLLVFDPTSGNASVWTEGELFSRGKGWVLRILPR